MRKWYEMSYKQLRKTVEFIQEQRAQKEEEILIMMRISPSYPATLRDIEEMFRKYPHLKLHRYKPFRAWYKYIKRDEVEDPEFYAKLLAAGMTPHEQDPYYDPNAPDWELYADRHEYPDGDEKYAPGPSRLGKAAAEGLFTGLGIGLGIGLFKK